ncbi:hypothetical protein SLA2020_270920 [Shorea laevis]
MATNVSANNTNSASSANQSHVTPPRITPSEALNRVAPGQRHRRRRGRKSCAENLSRSRPLRHRHPIRHRCRCRRRRHRWLRLSQASPRWGGGGDGDGSENGLNGNAGLCRRPPGLLRNCLRNR